MVITKTKKVRVNVKNYVKLAVIKMMLPLKDGIVWKMPITTMGNVSQNVQKVSVKTGGK